MKHRVKNLLLGWKEGGETKVGLPTISALVSANELATGPGKEKVEVFTYDDVLPHLGGFGRYQRRIYFLLCLPILLCAFHKLSGVFTQAKAKHRCQLPFESSHASYALESSVLNVSYPWDSKAKTWSSCSRLDANFTQEYLQHGVPANGSVACLQWVYDNSKYNSSTVTEFGLVCDHEYLRAMGDSMFVLGELIGSFTFGYLSDRYGRRPMFFIALVMQVVGGIFASFAPEVVSFIAARMLVGASIPGVTLVAYVIGMELVGPDKRVFAGVVCQFFFSTGYILVSIFAFYIHDWRTLQISLTLPGLVFLTYWWFIPESARWLMIKGRTDEAADLFIETAKKNNITVPVHVLNNLSRPEDQGSSPGDPTRQHDKASAFDLFRYPNLRKKTANIFFNWFVNNCAYYGLSWNTSNLGGNDLLNFLLSGLVEIPAYALLLFTLNRWGRKSILCGSMLTGGAFLLLTIAVPTDMNWLVITLFMLGKLAVTASYGTIYVFSVEQFPTVIRSVGLGASSTLARMGGITAPYVNLLASSWQPLPQLIFGGLIMIGGILALLLPETLGKQLPDTIAEGEEFGKYESNITKDKELGIKVTGDILKSSDSTDVTVNMLKK